MTSLLHSGHSPSHTISNKVCPSKHHNAPSSRGTSYNSALYLVKFRSVQLQQTSVVLGAIRSAEVLNVC
jgi:hypothetical protein